MSETPEHQPEFIVLHAQLHWHSEGLIVGNAAGLRRLRALIDDVLADDNRSQASAEVFATDGEGYDLHVASVEEPDIWEQPTGYTDEWARGGQGNPWDELRDPEQKPREEESDD